MQVVGEVHSYHHASGRGVDAHVVSGVVQELGARITLNVVRVVVPPAQLHVHPVLLSGCGIHHIPVATHTITHWVYVQAYCTVQCIVYVVEASLGVSEERGFGDIPLVGSEEENICTRAVHLVGLPGMDGLLLHCVDLQSIQFLVKHLQQPPHNTQYWSHYETRSYSLSLSQ